ncbi:MAG: metallophosphoesterase family protein [Nevskia sp.]|nr:metallophosphoesterase family protein [Nevskia sp.]
MPRRPAHASALVHPVLRVGLISDTHGLLRPEALNAMRGSDYIVHAGDIGDPAILQALQRVAPVTAVRGNNDRGAAYSGIAETEVLQAGETLIYVIHDLAELDLDPAAAEFQVVVSGHSHKPASRERDGVLYVNPGSAGPRRFSLPIAAALLHIRGRTVEVELLDLLPSS